MKDSPSGAHRNKQSLQAGLQQGKPEETDHWQPTPWSFSFRVGLRQYWWSCHSVPGDIKQTYPALYMDSTIGGLSVFHIKLKFSSHWSAQHRACLASSGGACKEEQSTHELSILIHSTLLARRRAHIPALLCVPGSTVKGSTHQVMGCSWGGMQITMVLFQLWTLKGGMHCLPDTASAPGHSPWPSQPPLMPNAAGLCKPGSCWTSIPCFRDRRTGEQHPGDTQRATRTITWLSV